MRCSSRLESQGQVVVKGRLGQCALHHLPDEAALHALLSQWHAMLKEPFPKGRRLQTAAGDGRKGPDDL